MKILVYGAGVIGSIYSAKLFDAGFDVTLLARGSRYENLKEKGIVIKEAKTGNQTISKIPLTQRLNADDFYDLIIVCVRLEQIDSIVPVLNENKVCPLIMFMFNYTEKIEQFKNELDPKQLILGFPGVGGTYENEVIKFIKIKEQKTTIGDIDGSESLAIKKVKSIFEKAGFKIEISRDMISWLQTHAVFISAISAAIIKEGGNSEQLGKNKQGVKMMVAAIREGFKACKNQGIVITPFNLKIIFMIMPQWFYVYYWQRALRSEVGTLAIAPHAVAAKNEMKLLSEKVLAMVHSPSIDTHTLDELLISFIQD